MASTECVGLNSGRKSRLVKTYACILEKREIPEDTESFFPHVRHQDGRSNLDIDHVNIYKCKMSKIPQGLTRVFPNLRYLTIIDSGIQEISKSDLAEYKECRIINFASNKIRYLPGDLFEGFTSLRKISFLYNKLTVVEPNILDGLDKLTYVNFEGNPNYNYFLRDSLATLKAQLLEKYLKVSPNHTNWLKKRMAVENELRRSYFEQRSTLLELKMENEKQKREIQKLTDSENESQKTIQKLKAEIEEINKPNNLVSDIKSRIQDESTKDFTIKIDDQQFRVHKFVLAARSETLAELLSNNPTASELKLVDISVKAFEKILSFLYTDHLADDGEVSNLKLFAAAAFLKIKSLMDVTALRILKDVNAENAIEIFKLSNRHGHDELREKSFLEIRKKYPKIPFKDEWKDDTEKVFRTVDVFLDTEEKIRDLQESFKALFE